MVTSDPNSKDVVKVTSTPLNQGELNPLKIPNVVILTSTQTNLIYQAHTIHGTGLVANIHHKNQPNHTWMVWEGIKVGQVLNHLEKTITPSPFLLHRSPDRVSVPRLHSMNPCMMGERQGSTKRQHLGKKIQ